MNFAYVMHHNSDVILHMLYCIQLIFSLLISIFSNISILKSRNHIFLEHFIVKLL